MKEAGLLRYLPWEDIIRWDQEIKAVKKDPYFKTNQAGQFMMFGETMLPNSDNSSDLKLLSMLKRRGVAMDLAGLLSYEVYDSTLVSWYMQELQREPAQKGYVRTTLNQVRTADEEIFVELAEQTAAGLNEDEDGKPPLDKVLATIVKNPRIVQFLVQMQGNGKAENDNSYRQEKRGIQDNKDLRAKIQRLEKMVAKGSGGKGGGKSSYQGAGGKDSKGKGKRSKTRGVGNMPYEMQGMEKSHGGKPICFGYNCKSGCSNNVDGNRMCSRGKHVCARKGCGGDHPAFSEVCPNRG